MSDSLNNEQRELLLTAYFDNELGPEESAQAKSILAEHPELAQTFQLWRENANSIRELPKFSLGDRFAERVMAAIEQADDRATSEIGIQHEAFFKPSDAHWNNGRIGMSVIATLAALILLTLFVFPAFNDSTVAVNQPEPPGTDKVVVPNDAPEDVSTATNDGQLNRRPIIGSRNSSLAGVRKNGQPVDPIKLAGETGPIVEQVLWVENRALVDLEKVLKNHSIWILDPDHDIQGQVHLVPQSTDRVEAVYVVSTAEKMKRAIAELSSETGSVTAFPLPSRFSAAETLPAGNAKTGSGSALQIKPLDLSDNGVLASEIASLDRWFGLVEDADDSRLIRFLLLVNTPSESASDVPRD